MKRLIALGVCLSLGLAACGGSSSKVASSIQSDPTAKQDAAKAKAIYHKCVKDPTALRSKAGRHAAFECAIPPKNQKAAFQCEVNGLLGHIPTQTRVIKVTLECIRRYA